MASEPAEPRVDVEVGQTPDPAALAAAQADFLKQYEGYVRDTLNPLFVRLDTLLKDWAGRDYWDAYREPDLPAPSPVRAVHARIKRPEAVVDKILRMPKAFPEGLSLASARRMTDALSGRVVVNFLSDLALIDREISDRADIRLAGGRPPHVYLAPEDAARAGLSDYSLAEKEWGSAAVTYRLAFAEDDGEELCFELQVRTLLEQAWADIMHQLGYRAGNNTARHIRERFQALGHATRSIEREVDRLQADLRELQRASDIREDDPLNAENLPRLLASVNVVAPQREIDGMIKVLSSRGVETVADFRRRATEDNVVAIRLTYRKDAGWPPTAFEVVATVAMLPENATESEVANLARLNLSYFEAWDEIVRSSLRDIA